MTLDLAESPPPRLARAIVQRTRGHSPGSIAPRVSPCDVGVIIGRDGDAVSEVSAPTTINYFDVALKRGERWRYQPPHNHTVAWVAVHKGKLAAPEIVDKGELAVFEESNGALEFEALEDTGFVLGSAVKHPHELALGMYSVHTSQQALERGEAKIAEIGKRLRAERRL